MFLFLLTSITKAEIPLGLFPNCSQEQQDQCPDDLNEKWYLIDWIPEVARESVRESEKNLGSGNGVNPAWAYSTGRFDVIVGIMDSGIKWEKDDLKNKFYLHQPELPIPQLEDGTTASSYDANGDGVFNLKDYKDDPRVQKNAGITGDNDKLDVSDLIYTFSDGIDDDGNGFVDDISGWDFFEQDNDAYHTLNRGYGTHGEGVARSVAAEGGNGGDIGVCPNCAILPLRVGDTFVSDGGRAAEAIAYGTDIGAVSITMAIGALSNSRSTEEAAEYAYENGTLLVGAAGDENSYHHNFPALLNNVVFVHSLSHNTGDNNAQVYSYMNTWNCNNFGARIDIVAAESACATGAVAQTVGAIALLQSAAKDQNFTLSSGEVYQLLIQNVVDVNLTEDERSTAKAYPSHEGWDPFFGYGRLHVGQAVEQVVNQNIPPAISIDYPEWFQVLDPTQQDSVLIQVEATARTSDISWSMEYGLGSDPQNWTELASGTDSASSGQDMTFSAELDLTQIPAVVMEEASFSEDIVERLERVNTPSVTVRVFVTDADGRESVMRKTFFVHRDSGLKSGFPIRLDGSGEGAPVVYDVTGDGVMEIIVGDASGYVHIFDGSGSELDGWPVQTQIKPGVNPNASAFDDVTPIHDAISSSPAVGDIDGDGELNVVALGFDGGIYAWNIDGSVVDGFPQQAIGRDVSELTEYQTFDQGFLGAPTLYDLNGDGALEIIASGLDSRLYVFEGTGDYFGNYPIELCYPDECALHRARSINSPSIGDIDGDGKLEIAVGTNEAVINETRSVSYLIDAETGEYEEGWPLAVRGLVGEAVLLPLIGEGHPASLTIADVDGDGDMELTNAVMLGMNGPVHHDGSEFLDISFVAADFPEDFGADVASLVQMASQPVWGDLTGDGVPEFITPAVSSIYLASLASRTWVDYQQPIGAWDGVTGTMLNGWPRQIEDLTLLSGTAVADVSGDGNAEVIAGSAGYLVHAWDKDGTEADGWPKFTGNWMIATPAVGDIDGDGFVDVVISTREGWLFAWGTEGRADQKIEWASLFHDAQNTGNYHTPLPTQAGPVDEEEIPKETGCCKDKSGDSAWLLLPLLFLGYRRRK